ncbi:MAG: alpha/beta fold hydrolase BchO [Pseudomonadota bacterium]
MFFTPERLSFERDGKNWPHRQHSRFVRAYGLSWHVQEMGEGELTLVLIHGTGASTHSWRALMDLLSPHARVIAFDLPGQGFTDRFDDADPTLPTMAAAVGALLQELALEKPVLIGHSAGAAVSLQVALDGAVDVQSVISINGALYPFPGAASSIFPMLAKLLFLNPFMPHLFAMGAGGKHRVERLLDGTGSTLDDEGLSLYQTLFKNPSHVRATLAWMANWNLVPLVQAMANFDKPFLQIIGAEDRTIEPGNAYETEQRIKGAKTIMVPKLGHLVHEEAPEPVAKHILDFISARQSDEPLRDRATGSFF